MNILKYYRLKRKIRKQLPKYDPTNGNRLYWYIYLGEYRNKNGYSIKTGKPNKRVFVPKLKIQSAWRGTRTSDNAYNFIWATKEMIVSGQWMYF